jgi:hypothetical protein
VGIKHYKRFEEATFTRLTRGLVAWAPGVQAFNAPANPSLGLRLVLGPDMPRGCISGKIQRPYLLSAGFELKSAAHNYRAEVWNNALASSLDTYIDATMQTTASATGENNMVPLKLDVSPTNLRAWLEGIYPSNVRPVTLAGPLTPAFVMNTNQTAQAGGGNRYDFYCSDLYVCRSNEFTFQSLPAYGSVRMTINAGAPVVVNVNGNGDATYDLGALAFPCAVLFETFDGANATGKKVGRVFVRDAYGGDVFGNIRAELPAASFSPLKIKRCELWLDPFALQGADASAVTVWPDSSGAARDFAKLSTLPAPTLRRSLLNCPAVDFTGQVMFNNTLALRTDNETIAIVLKHRTEATPHGYFSQCYNGAGGITLCNNGGSGVLATLTNGYKPIAGATENTLKLVVMELDKLTNRLRVWLNGNNTPSIDVANDAPAFNTVTTAIGALYCDQPNANYNALLGSALIGEVIIYSKKLRDGDRQNLSSYLRTKWGNAW